MCAPPAALLLVRDCCGAGEPARLGQRAATRLTPSPPRSAQVSVLAAGLGCALRMNRSLVQVARARFAWRLAGELALLVALLVGRAFRPIAGSQGECKLACAARASRLAQVSRAGVSCWSAGAAATWSAALASALGPVRWLFSLFSLFAGAERHRNDLRLSTQASMRLSARLLAHLHGSTCIWSLGHLELCECVVRVLST